MRREGTCMLFVMLLSALLMFGCGTSGGGGGTIETSGDTGTGGAITGDDVGVVTGDASNSPGFVVLHFRGIQQRASALRSSSSTNLPSPTHARIVVRQFSTVDNIDIDGNFVGQKTVTSYKQIKDVEVTSSGTLTVYVTPGIGYRVDVISYVVSTMSGTHKSLLKYGNASGIDVVSGASTTIDIATTPFNVGLTVPATMESGSSYDVTCNYGDAPLRYIKNLRVTYENITDLFAYDVSNVSFRRKADVLAVSDQARTAHFQGLFFLTNDLLNARTESWKDWRYYEPNPAEFLDSEVTATITPPGEIAVNITL